MSPKHMTGETRRHLNLLKQLRIISNKYLIKGKVLHLTSGKCDERKGILC